MPLLRVFMVILLVGLPASVQAGDSAAGAKIYKKYCRGCHGKDGRGGAHTFMPHIHNLTKKGYIDLLPDEHLAGVIREGGKPYGLSAYMPAWGKKLSDEEIDQLVAHIRTLPLH